MTEPQPSYPQVDPDDPNAIPGQELHDMMGLSPERLHAIRTIVETVEPNALAVYVLVDVPDLGVALVGTSGLDESIDIFGLLHDVVNQQPISEYKGVHGSDDVRAQAALLDLQRLAQRRLIGHTSDEHVRNQP